MQELAMSTEVWAIISAVIVILVAIATSHRALRQEMNERFEKVNERIDVLRAEMIEGFGKVNERFGKADERVATLRAEMIEGFGKVNERITTVRGELLDRITAVRGELLDRIAAVHGELIDRITTVRGELIDRLSHVEGLLEGIGHVVRKRTGKERRDAEHGPADPQP